MGERRGAAAFGGAGGVGARGCPWLGAVAGAASCGEDAGPPPAFGEGARLVSSAFGAGVDGGSRRRTRPRRFADFVMAVVPRLSDGAAAFGIARGLRGGDAVTRSPRPSPYSARPPFVDFLLAAAASRAERASSFAAKRLSCTPTSPAATSGINS